MKLKKLIPLIGILTFFTACGGSGGGSENNISRTNSNQREVTGISNVRLKRVIRTTTTNYNSASTSKVEVTYEYDSNNLLKQSNYDFFTLGRDFVMEHIYDSNNYLVKMIGSHGYDVNYEYDDNGRMIKRSDLKNGVLFEETRVVKWDNNNPIELKRIPYTSNSVNISIKNRFTANELTHSKWTMTSSNFNATSVYDTKYDMNTYHPMHYVNIGASKTKDIAMSYYYNKIATKVNVIGHGGRKMYSTFTKNKKGIVTEIEEVTTYDGATRIVVNSSYEYEKF